MPQPPPTGGTYLGCFVDTNSPYNLDGYLERSASNTPERCVNTCREKGFRFAGVEYVQSCLCGNRYDRYRPAENRNMQCTGDQSKTCGGFNANSVYSTGLLKILKRLGIVHGAPTSDDGQEF